MPELPDLTVLIENLIDQIKGLKIVKIIEIDKGSIKGDFPTYENLGKIEEISRRGKYIIFKTEKITFYIHLMLTGKIHLTKDSSIERSRVEFKLSNGLSLIVSDKRRLAYISANLTDLPKGIEPLSPSFTFENFSKLTEKGKRKTIKSFLMDQDLIAGIGNAYSDEIMYVARLNPLRKIESLINTEKKRLYNAIIDVLKQAIIDVKEKMGKDLELDEERLYLQVHKKKGKKCASCGGTIETVHVDNKIAYYCPICQK
jgi:formamidopyrimidine-DNA glycosylase